MSPRSLAAGVVGLGLMAGCGGGGGGGPTAVFSIGGAINGLTADGLTLTDGQDTVSPMSGAKTFQFPTKLPSAATYAVAVSQSPPALTCTVANGSGVVNQGAPADIAINCVPVMYVLGGSIAGAIADGLVLTNGGEPLSIAAGANSFEFATKLVNGTAYSVTVTQVPPGQYCFVSNGAGSINLQSPTNITVTCKGSEWTWVSGSSAANPPLTAATEGTTSVNPPSARRDAVSWTDAAGRFWVFGGEAPYAEGTGYPNDLWRYDPASSEWTLVRDTRTSGMAVYGTQGVASAAGTPGGRHWASSWIDRSGDLWVFGGIGYDVNGMWGLMNDLWRFQPDTGRWTWMSGSKSVYALSVYGPVGTATASAVPGARDRSVTFLDAAGDLWLYGGFGDQPDGQSRGALPEMWKYAIASGEWTLVSGNGTLNTPSVYGTQGVGSTSNTPGGRIFNGVWQTAPGEVVLFGGESYEGYRSDLWKYSTVSGQWVWIYGPATAGSQNSYGALGVDSAGNAPAARVMSASWVDLAGNLWMFGGSSDGTSAGLQIYDDLWEFRASTQHWVWISGSSSPNASGSYGTLGVPAATNRPGSKIMPLGWTDATGRFWLFGGAGYDASGGVGYMNDMWVFQAH